MGTRSGELEYPRWNFATPATDVLLYISSIEPSLGPPGIKPRSDRWPHISAGLSYLLGIFSHGDSKEKERKREHQQRKEK